MFSTGTEKRFRRVFSTTSLGGMGIEFFNSACQSIVRAAERYPLVSLKTGSSGHAKTGKRFTFPKLSESGFDVVLEVFDYGVYPYAEAWHGAPWDVTVFETEELAKSIDEFIDSVLTPAGSLNVYYSNGKPYKWVLRRSFEGEMVAEETGLIFFNWFGKRATKRFVNNA